MNDDELRALVRELVARHAGAAGSPASGPPALTVRFHPSHGMLKLPAGSDTEGPCLIEPAVPCNHCGYCTSYGH